MRSTTRSSLCLLALLLAAPATGQPGVLEINRACATGPGCFPGDAPGFPVTITSGGSYRLSGNLSSNIGSPQNFHYVEIIADNVTLDLAGFRISCNNITLGGVCTGSGSGIVSNATGTTVHGGTVSGMADDGIDLGDQGHVYDVRVENSGDEGIVVGGFSLVRNSIVRANADDGIRTGVNSVVESCAASENQRGIRVSNGSVVRGNTAYDNLTSGISAGHSTTLVENTASSNGGVGFFLGSSFSASGGGGLAKANVAVGNAEFGFDNGVLNPQFPIPRTQWGLLDNVARDNNDGGDQIRGGIEMGQNLCGGNLTCP